jgi:hypothetical protein
VGVIAVLSEDAIEDRAADADDVAALAPLETDAEAVDALAEAAEDSDDRDDTEAEESDDRALLSVEVVTEVVLLTLTLVLVVTCAVAEAASARATIKFLNCMFGQNCVEGNFMPSEV